MRLSRRSFLAGAVAVPAGLRAVAQDAGITPRWVLLGSDKGKGIYRAAWNAATGELGPAILAGATPRPSYLAAHPSLPVIYAVNAAGGTGAALSSFRVDPTNAELRALAHVPSEGDGPCYVSVDRESHYAFVANYSGGSFAAFPLGANGELGRATFSFKNDNRALPGPVRDRQDAAHLHCAVISPANDFVLACDLGSDSIFVFPAEVGSTRPTLRRHIAAEFEFPARPGSGPRHVAFHPNGRWVYCIHELDSTIDLYDWSVAKGVPTLKLREGSTLSTLAAGSSLQGNTACEFVVGDSGRFAYACTRGENSITIYSIAPETGLLTEQQRVSCGGAVPRIITFDPSRRWLLCANQGSSSVTVFAHNASTGRLSDQPKTFSADTPMFIQFI